MDWVTVSVRFALYFDLTTLFGLPLFGLYALRREELSSRIGSRHVTVTAVIAAIGIVLSLANMAVMAKGMTGASEYSELQSHVFEMILTGTDFGAAWTVRLVALLLCLLLALFARRWPRFQFGALAATAGIALSTLAWAGHGAMGDGGQRYLHLASDIAHLMAAGAWVGALVAFVMLSRPSSPASAALLSRTSNGFAQVGTIMVATLTVTGAMNYWVIVGPTLPDDLSLTSYGGLLIVKLTLFGTMLALAAANRFRLAPQLEQAVKTGDHDGAVRTLRRSLMFETSAATLILALVASLGVLSPAGM
ncbi:copper homeostasis membrane protein CopD [Cupriavidus necator]|uniref:copper homeostasis membrane protein CopD n=1 Tax=Cupriavidus necator TaxID=106590 RepID=UPI0039C21689